MLIDSKKCSRCARDLPLSAFSADRRKIGGLRYDCSACRSLFRKRDSKEKRASRWAAYAATNRERIRAKQREFKIAHRESINAAKREHRRLNKEVYAQQLRVAYLADRDRFVAKVTRRRGRKAQAGGSVTKADILRLKVAQRGRCAMCRISLRRGYHLDHIMPLALGGFGGASNIQLLCAPCNLSKGARHPIDFAQARGLLL
jgi:5-methylcytosine-specific restriction endonuclease McrA